MLRARDTMDRAYSQPLDICFDVGFSSLGTFSRTFKAVVGEPPATYRARFAGERNALRVPACWAMAWMRPAG
jgi:transcriptional regulator GlxA family with amidase domain